MSTGRISSFQHDGFTFDVQDGGPLDGDVVLLLHGFPQMNTCWRKVTPLLHDAGLRTLTPNQRGFSPGARPSGRRAYSGSRLVEDAAALVREVGGPVHVVGHDWGGAVAWVLAARRPELVRTLVSVAGPHPGAFLKAMPRGQALKSWYMAFFNLPGLPELVLRNRSAARRALLGGGMTEEMFERFWTDFIDGGALRGGLGWYRAMPFGDPADLRTPVTVPTTHVWGDGDDFLSRASADLCEQFVADAPYELEVLPGSHWLPEEAPDRIAEIILDRVRSSTVAS